LVWFLNQTSIRIMFLISQQIERAVLGQEGTSVGLERAVLG